MMKAKSRKAPLQIVAPSRENVPWSKSRKATPSSARPRRDYCSYVFELEDVRLPEELMFQDMGCSIPNDTVDLRGWFITEEYFEKLATSCRRILSTLLLDNVMHCPLEAFEKIRGLPKLQTLSLVNAISLDASFGTIIASFSKLEILNLSECSVDSRGFEVISLSCHSLNTLICARCKNLDDACLVHLGSCIQRFRQLGTIDLSQSHDFSDDGVLALLNGAQNVLREFSLESCKNITTLATAGFRKKMSVLEKLDLSNMSLGQTSFEWITEGCLRILELNLSRSFDLDDAGLLKISKNCRQLESIDISRCAKVSDAGIEDFLLHLGRPLRSLDMSLCILCTGRSAIAISRNASKLEVLRLNGLSQINSTSLASVWREATSMRIFEMTVELRATSMHRRSMISHVSDDALCSTIDHSPLEELRLTGACQISDVGVCDVVRKSPHIRHLDVSYCHLVTDKFLIELGRLGHSMTSLNISGCSITNIGLAAMCCGCRELKRLEFNGCSRVNDDGVAPLACLGTLQFLSMRNCEYVTDASLSLVAVRCKALRSVDISGLDLVSARIPQLFAQNCPYLTHFNCITCNFTAKEFAAVTGKAVLLAQPVNKQCKLEPRPSPVANYNRLVHATKEKQLRVRVLQALCKVVCRLRFERAAAMARPVEVEVIVKPKKRFKPKAATVENKPNPKHVAASLVMQAWTRRTLARRLAKFKLHQLRLRRDSAILIQKVFKGRWLRKRVKRKFDNLYIYYSKIGRIAHKLLVLHAARRLHRQILMVQSMFRMLPTHWAYDIAKRGVRRFQYKFRNYFRRRKSARQAVNSIILALEFEYDNAWTIQRAWRARMFNKNMSKFTLICGYYYFGEKDSDEWHAVIIQKYYRGFICRLQLKRLAALPHIQMRAIKRIQKIFRGWRGRKRYQMVFNRFWIFRWKWRVFVCAMPFLRLGYWCKRIQRAYRLYRFRLGRYQAACRIKKAYRQYKARVRHTAFIMARLDHLCWNIITLFRRYKARNWRHRKMEREHMAVWKIQYYLGRAFREIKRKRNAIALAAKRNRENVDDKVRLVLQRRNDIVAKIYHRNLVRHAKKVQRVFRIWIVEVRKRHLAEERRRKLLEESMNASESLDLNKLKAGTGSLLAGPLRTLGRTVDRLRKVMLEEPLITEKDHLQLSAAVLKYHKQSIVQEGVVDIRLTVGGVEANSFMQVQEKARQMHKPHFIRLPQDLSGASHLDVFLWKKLGTGIDCICQLVLKEFTAKSKESITETMTRGNKVAYNANLPFQIVGICAMKHNTEGYPLNDIELALTEEERVDLEERGFLLVDNLSRFGFPVTIWSTSKTPSTDPQLHNYRLLTSISWFTKELLRVAMSYKYSQSDIFAMRAVFDEMNGRSDAEAVRITDLCYFLGYPKNKILEWVVLAVRPRVNAELAFDEYVYMISFYSMFAKKEMNQFLFGAMDVMGNNYLTPEEFNKFIEYLGEGSGRNLKNWQHQYYDFCDDKLKMIFIKGFHKFVEKNPSVVWQARYLQRLFVRYNLGEEYWNDKMEQFRITRQEMGVKMHD